MRRPANFHSAAEPTALPSQQRGGDDLKKQNRLIDELSEAEAVSVAMWRNQR